MEIKDVIIGLMAFAALGLLIFGFVSTFYSPDNLEVSMPGKVGEDFNTLYANLNRTRSETDMFTQNLTSYAPGGTNASVVNDQITTSDLLVSSMKALTTIPQTLSIFSHIIITIGNVLGIDSIVVGFIIGSLVVTIIIILITAVLKWNSG